MKKIYFIILAMMFYSGIVKAQEISPTDLFQIYKVWQMNDPNYYKYTYQYLMTVDKHWTVAYPPIEKDGLMLVFGFKLDSAKWYKPHEYELSLVNDHTRPVPKEVIYSFTDITLWNIYNHQMELMNAKRITEGSVDGGHQVIYKVNDIVIFLKEFPPGINGDDRIYQVQMGHELTN